MGKIVDTFIELLKFTGITIELTLAGITIGVFLGLFLAVGRLSTNKFYKGLAGIYIWIFRGTPLLMQLFFIYYALPMMSPLLRFPQLVAAIIVLSLNAGAYLAEIMRVAILSIDKGQMEASKALGMTYTQAMTRIIIPQSYRRLIPPVGNEVIMLLKDSALVSTIAVTELLRRSKQILNNTGDPMIFLYTATIYLFLTSILTVIFQRLEAKYSVYE